MSGRRGPRSLLRDRHAIIFITGAPERVYRTLSFGVGGVAHLQKPFTPAQRLLSVSGCGQGQKPAKTAEF